jgi:hypothetical protein
MLLIAVVVLVLVAALAIAASGFRSALREPPLPPTGGGGAIAVPDQRATVKRVALRVGAPMFVAGGAAGYLILALTPFLLPHQVAIYIGDDAPAGEFAFATAMIRNADVECGGTLFRLEDMPANSGPQWVLTAAHCYPEMSSGFAYGNLDRKKMPPPAPIDRVCFHPELDAAVARLKSVTVQPFAAVLKQVSLQQDARIEILGWGATYKKDTSILQHATLALTKTMPCGRSTQNACFAAASKTAASTCSGDSGSPALLDWNRGQPAAVAGLATTISSCGGNKSHFVGTSLLIPWIKQMTQDPSTCKAI